MNSFPYDGKSSFDPVLVEDVAKAHLKVEDLLLGMVRVDPHVKLIARFDGDLDGHLGQSGLGSGSIRYWDGRFTGSKGVLVEQSGSNLVTNPSAEVDLAGWSAHDPSLELLRDGAVAYTDNGTVGAASFKLQGTGDAGPGYIKSSATVNVNSKYSASVYIQSSDPVKAKLEMAFTGGTPVTYTSGEVAVPSSGWMRVKLEDKDSTDNTACELRIYLVQDPPVLAGGSRFSKLVPSGTALVTDAGMPLAAGDVVMCAVTAAPAGPEKYSWHMVTTGGTGVSDAALRLDGSSAAPTFVDQSRLSKWGPNATVPATDNGTIFNAGHFLFCQLEGEEYAWHLVTASGSAVSTSLRLDDAPGAPRFASGSQISRFLETGSALENDNGMVISAGDFVFCHVLANPAAGAYGWHLVTSGATGVANPALRLDDSFNAPDFAKGSRLSRMAPGATAPVTDNGMVISAGDFVFCLPTANPAAGAYGWHMATTGGTGVTSPALRLDQTSSRQLSADAVQLEQSALASTYIDGFQGAGYAGFLGTASTREAAGLSYAASGALGAASGTVGFWIFPLWGATDGQEHVLFDAAESSGRNRIRFSKDAENRLVLSVYDDDAGLRQLVSNAPVNFPAEQWLHLGFTYGGGNLKMFQAGQEVAANPTGPGSGQVNPVPPTLYLGSDFLGTVTGGALFDDLVVKDAEAGPGEMAALGSGNSPCRGLALALGGFTMGVGNATTDVSAGVQSAVAHGLGVTPSFLQITERSNGLVYLSAPADATSFYVKGSAPSLAFDWRAYA